MRFTSGGRRSCSGIDIVFICKLRLLYHLNKLLMSPPSLSLAYIFPALHSIKVLSKVRCDLAFCLLFTCTLYLSWTLANLPNQSQDSTALAVTLVILACSALYTRLRCQYASQSLGVLVAACGIGAYQMCQSQPAYSLSTIAWLGTTPSVLLLTTECKLSSLAAGLIVHYLLTPALTARLGTHLRSLDRQAAASAYEELLLKFESSSSLLMGFLLCMCLVKELEHRAYAATLTKAVLRAESAAKASEDLVAAVSHDLRNPLNW
jgi:signal transduction histidine kinase